MSIICHFCTSLSLKPTSFCTSSDSSCWSLASSKSTKRLIYTLVSRHPRLQGSARNKTEIWDWDPFQWLVHGMHGNELTRLESLVLLPRLVPSTAPFQAGPVVSRCQTLVASPLSLTVWTRGERQLITDLSSNSQLVVLGGVTKTRDGTGRDVPTPSQVAKIRDGTEWWVFGAKFSRLKWKKIVLCS